MTRFRMNVAQYPKLFTAWLAGCLIAVTELYVAQLVGVRYTNAADLVLSLALAGLIYRWIAGSSCRRAILSDIAERFEGRDVCCVQGHYADEEPSDDEYDIDDDETDEDETDEEPEEEEL